MSENEYKQELSGEWKQPKGFGGRKFVITDTEVNKCIRILEELTMMAPVVNIPIPQQEVVMTRVFTTKKLWSLLFSKNRNITFKKTIERSSAEYVNPNRNKAKKLALDLLAEMQKEAM